MLYDHGYEKTTYRLFCFPLEDQAKAIQAVKSLGYNDSEQKQIFYDNARKLLGLSE